MKKSPKSQTLFEKHFSFQSNQAVACSHFSVDIYMLLLHFKNSNFIEVCDIVSTDHSNFNILRISKFQTFSVIFNNFRCQLTKYTHDILFPKSKRHHSLRELMPLPSQHMTSKVKFLLTFNQKSTSYLLT